MRLVKRATIIFTCFTLLLALAGCPLVPTLNVETKNIAFLGGQDHGSIRIQNTSSLPGNWTVEEVRDISAPGGDVLWNEEDVSWLSLPTPGGTLAGNSVDLIPVKVSADDLGAGTYSDVGIKFTNLASGEVTYINIALVVSATLSVSPTDIVKSSTDTSASFTVTNISTQPVSWEVLYLPNPLDTENAQAFPNDIAVSPIINTSSAGEQTTVNVNWFSGQEDFYMLVRSAVTSVVVSVRFIEVSASITASPNPITLYLEPDADSDSGPQSPVTLTLSNSDTNVHFFEAEPVLVSDGSATDALSVSPTSGSIGNESTFTLDVAVADPGEVVEGSGVYQLFITTDDGFVPVNVIVERRSLPIIELSEAPDPLQTTPPVVPITALDFGTDLVQLSFWVTNIGETDSELYFRIAHEDEDSATPLIASVVPDQGNTVGSDNDFYIQLDENDSNALVGIDGVEITVTINRNNLTSDLETRTITVSAYDSSFNSVLTGVEAAEITVTVERPPMVVEGAVNRARPPYVTRFVLTLRDTLGNAIPTLTEAERAKISFTVTEDGEPIDLLETNKFITGPQNLRGNLVLLLDYSGSMYLAGTNDAANPLEPGEALSAVNAAAKDFINDLPSNYQVALMATFDKNDTVLLQGLTTDKLDLVAALDNLENGFIASDAGFTAIRDALMEAIDVLINGDPEGILPFDEADIRAVLFVTEGKDQSSATTLSTLTGAAEEAYVRLYPLAYAPVGSSVTTDLIPMASDTGGHLYTAGTVDDLVTLLSNVEGMTLTSVATGNANEVKFAIGNDSADSMTWSISGVADVSWISNISQSSGTLAPGASSTISITVDASLLPVDSRVQGTLSVTSSAGNGSIDVVMTVSNPAAVPADDISLLLRDATGQVWEDIRNQIALTYITPTKTGTSYQLQVRYTQDNGSVLDGMFQEDGGYYSGNDHVGQISLYTTGIIEDPAAALAADQVRAEVMVRADYVPRSINQFRMRFYLEAPSNIGPTAQAALQNAQIDVELAADGLLVAQDAADVSWRLISQGDGIYDILTDQDNTLPFGSFGDLLTITVSNLSDYVNSDAFSGSRAPVFYVKMRLDNNIYPVSNGIATRKYFTYPGCAVSPLEKLTVDTLMDDLASPADTILELAYPGIDPDAEFAWDRDEDDFDDFFDPDPDDPDVPGSLLIPNPMQFDVSSSTVTPTDQVITLQNNRLDSFTWTLSSVVPAALAGLISIDAPDEGTTLAPGESTTFTVTFSQNGVTPNIYTNANDDFHITLTTDTFGDEILPITAIVGP